MILNRFVKSNRIPRSQSSHYRFGLRAKFLSAFLLLILFPFLTLGILAYRQSARVIEKNVSRYTLETMRQISINVDYNLYEMERITQFLTLNEDLLTNLRDYHLLPNIKKVNINNEINKTLINISGLRSELSGVYLFNTYGDFFYTRGRSPRLGYQCQREQWYQETIVKAGSINIIGTHLQYHVQNKPGFVISVARAIRNFSTRETLGVALVDFDYQILEKIIGNEFSDTFSASDLYILDQKNTIIFNKNPKLLTTSFNYPFKNALQAHNEGTFIATLNRQRIFVVFYTSPYSTWKIVSMTPLNHLLKEIIVIRNSLILIMLICMALAFLLSLEVSYKLVKPIKSLVGAMTKMEQGNLSASIDIKTNDETRLLADSFNSMARNIQNLIEKVYHAQLNQKEAELNALQSQINPHFLYNTLESIRGVAIAENVPSIALMAKSLSSLFRYSICKGKEIVSIKEEIEHVKNYIAIQNFRYEDKFAVEYRIADSLSDYRILKLILQPLVENAIQHGLETKMGRGKIIIACEQTGALLRITIADNGVGIPEAKVSELNQSLSNNRLLISDSGTIQDQSGGTRSIGIFNVNARIKLYFGNEYGLKFTSQETVGTTVEIFIPAIKGEMGHTQDIAGR